MVQSPVIFYFYYHQLGAFMADIVSSLHGTTVNLESGRVNRPGTSGEYTLPKEKLLALRKVLSGPDWEYAVDKNGDRRRIVDGGEAIVLEDIFTACKHSPSTCDGPSAKSK
jgi:hypothetical protein